MLCSQLFDGSCSPCIRPLAPFLFFMAHSYFSTREHLCCQHWGNAAQAATEGIVRAILQQHYPRTAHNWKDSNGHSLENLKDITRQLPLSISSASPLTNTYTHTSWKTHLQNRLQMIQNRRYFFQFRQQQLHISTKHRLSPCSHFQTNAIQLTYIPNRFACFVEIFQDPLNFSVHLAILPINSKGRSVTTRNLHKAQYKLTEVFAYLPWDGLQRIIPNLTATKKLVKNTL